MGWERTGVWWAGQGEDGGVVGKGEEGHVMVVIIICRLESDEDLL